MLGHLLTDISASAAAAARTERRRARKTGPGRTGFSGPASRPGWRGGGQEEPRGLASDGHSSYSGKRRLLLALARSAAGAPTCAPSDAALCRPPRAEPSVTSLRGGQNGEGGAPSFSHETGQSYIDSHFYARNKRLFSFLTSQINGCAVVCNTVPLSNRTSEPRVILLALRR